MTANDPLAPRPGDAYPEASDGEGSLGGQEFDGIEIVDRPVPAWWKWVFVATIAFSFPYFAFYHFGASGRSLEDIYTVAVSENARLQFAEIGELRGDQATLVRFLEKPQWLSVGRSVYRSNCASCHGRDGGGLVGPNLTDDHYKNVKSIEDIVRVVNTGAAAGAMPAWQGRLEQNERVLVAAYVASLRGTDPSGSAKGPEGAVIPEWPTIEEIEAETTDEEESTAEGNDAAGVSPAEADTTEADATGANGLEAGSTEAGSTEAGSTEAGSTEAGSTEAGSTEAGAASRDTSEVDAAEADGAPADVD